MIADIDSTTQINTLNTKKAALVSYQAQLKAKKPLTMLPFQAITAYQNFIRKKPRLWTV